MSVYSILPCSYMCISMFSSNLFNYLAGNYPPSILTGNITLEIQVGYSYPTLLTLDVEDKNGDDVYFSLSPGAPIGLSISNATNLLSWNNVTGDVNETFYVTVTDGSAESVWTPKIKLCNCQVGDHCFLINIITTG